MVKVDLYIEVDYDLVQNHDTDTVNMPNTINYVNALVTAVSRYVNQTTSLLVFQWIWSLFTDLCCSIYEREVDTHREWLWTE